MYRGERSRRETAAIAGVALLHAAVAYLALRPMTVELPAASAPLMIAEITPPAPAPEPLPEPPRRRAPRPEGEASAANKRARPSEVVAPKPPIELPPPPVVAAPVASTGPDASAGAAPVAGPGSGAGGQGAGLGSGGQGTGTGGGGSAVRLIKGRIRDSDYPRSASRAEIGGAVVVYFDVGPNGRPAGCRVVVSSGNADLDSTTCRLIEKRFRYKPATDAQGRVITTKVGWRQEWWLEPRR